MPLSKIQKNFKEMILEPDYSDREQEVFRAMFRQNYGIALENRMKVYRNNIVRGLSDAAMAALPMTRKLVGEAFLEQAMRHYVLQNLPEEGNLTLYGMGFPDFIKEYEPARHLPYLSDFTRLEWAWEAAYYADDDRALDPVLLADISEEKLLHLVFAFRSSFSLLDSVFPLDEIVDFCRADEAEEMHELSNKGAKLMVFRPDLKVEIRKLDESEYKFLKLLQQGQTIERVVVTLLESDPNFNITDLLQKHLRLGTFSDFEMRS